MDLIIIDVMMPWMNGLELLDLLRGKNLTKQIPVLLISGLAQWDNRDFLQYGKLDLMCKPIDIELLFEKMEKLLGGG